MLARVEAALAALGLLDAWVTLDGVYSAERDGDDAVLALGHVTDGPEGGATLAELLQPGEGPDGPTNRGYCYPSRSCCLSSVTY